MSDWPPGKLAIGIGVASALCAALLIYAFWTEDPALRRSSRSSTAPDPHAEAGKGGQPQLTAADSRDGTLRAELVVQDGAWFARAQEVSLEVRRLPDEREANSKRITLALRPDVFAERQGARFDISSVVGPGEPPEAVEVRAATSAQWLRVPLHSYRRLLNRSVVAEYVVRGSQPSEVSRVQGRIYSERDGPLQGAAVGAFRFEAGTPSPQAAAVSESNLEGIYSFHDLPSGQYLIVAAKAGFAAASLLLALDGRDTVAEDLQLATGYSISGGITCCGRPLSHALVMLRHHLDEPPAARSRRPLHLGVHHFSWVGGALVFPTNVSLTTDSFGRFILSGLTAADYSLQLYSAPGVPLFLSRSTDATVVVSAPQAGVSWSIDAVLCRVRVSQGRTPVDGASVSLESASGGTTASTGASGEVEFLVSLASSIRVTVEHGAKRMTGDLTSPDEAGQEMLVPFDLSTVPEPCRALIRVTDELGGPVRRARLSARSLDPAASQEAPVEYALEADDGCYELAVGHAGRHLLTVLPGAAEEFDMGHFFVGIRDAVVLVPGESIFTYSARRGGRLSITAVAGNGMALRAHCTIRGANGQELPVAYRTETAIGFRTGPAPLPGGAPSVTVEPLLPGNYQVEVWVCESGEGAKVVAVEVKPGVTTPVTVGFP